MSGPDWNTRGIKLILLPIPPLALLSKWRTDSMVEDLADMSADLPRFEVMGLPDRQIKKIRRCGTACKIGIRLEGMVWLRGVSFPKPIVLADVKSHSALTTFALPTRFDSFHYVLPLYALKDVLGTAAIFSIRVCLNPPSVLCTFPTFRNCTVSTFLHKYSPLRIWTQNPLVWNSVRRQEVEG